MPGKVYRGNFQELNRLCAIKDARIAELEAALREIAAGQIDAGGNRRNHEHATAIARRALGLSD